MQFSRYMFAPLTCRPHSLRLAPDQLGLCFANTSQDIHSGTFLYVTKVWKSEVSFRVEMKRFELSTPCLQGRCSPN